MKHYVWMLLPFLVACGARNKPADLVIKGGPIYTMDQNQPTAEGVAVAGDSIVYVGDLANIEKWVGPQTKIIDLKGRMMAPGFIESHGHLMGLGESEMAVSLENISSYQELVDRVKAAIAKAQPGEWIFGWGWHQEKWTTHPDKLIKGFQTHELLSAISPDNPVYLEHASGHAVFVNERAMRLAGINQLAIEKLNKDMGPGGEIIRDPLGNPTGIFTEQAQALIHRVIPDPSPESLERSLSLALTACLRNGIASFHDAGTSQTVIDLYNKFKTEGKLDVRLYVMIEGARFKELHDWYKKGPLVDPDHWLTVRSIKLRCDGALGSRGAWLMEPYTDRKDFSGMATLPMDSVSRVATDALNFGFQVCSHAIGDRANHEILDRYEKAFETNPAKAGNARFRIEHAQHLLPSDIPRFGKLGVIASMQSIHLSSDRPWAIDRLGEKRINEGAYVWQSLLQTGAKVINGTDVPVEPINPVSNFYASVSRKTLKGQPKGGYEPKQRMTREQALRAYTLDAAFGAFEEDIKGSIQIGKLADFTVFSRDLMTAPENELLKTEIAMTIVGGKVMYSQDE